LIKAQQNALIEMVAQVQFLQFDCEQLAEENRILAAYVDRLMRATV
jgi:hypothetical protein